MSKIGKLPVSIPDGVAVNVADNAVKVSGPKGELSFSFRPEIKVEIDNNEIKVMRKNDSKFVKALHGLTRSLIANMMKGVTEGYVYELRIVFKHFPINVSAKGDEIQIKNFLGEKSVRTAQIIGKTDVKIDKESVIVKGINKEEVGQTAANIELACKLRNRDRRIFQDGIFIFNKTR